MIYGKVASLWLLFSWLTLFPELDAPVRPERQPTDADILAAFPQGAVEIGPNAGVDAVLAHHRSGHHHPHDLLHLAEHHGKKSECADGSGGFDHARCLRHHHPTKHKAATLPESLAQQPPAFSPEPEQGMPDGDNPPPSEPTRQNRSGFLQGRAASRFGHQDGKLASAPSLLASHSGSSQTETHHPAGNWSHGMSHHEQHTITQSDEQHEQTNTGVSQTAHHSDSWPQQASVAEVASSSTEVHQEDTHQQAVVAEVASAQQAAGEHEQHEHSAASDKLETTVAQSHEETVITPVTASESKNMATSTTSSTPLLVAANNSGGETLQQDGVKSEVRSSATGDGSHAHQKSDETSPLTSGRDTLAVASAKENHQGSQESTGTNSVPEATSAVGTGQELVTAALNETSLLVEESVVMPALMSMRAAFFAEPLLSASWSEQSSAAEATPVNGAPLAYALASGSQGYVLDQLTDGADYVIRLQGAGSGSLQQLTLSGTLADSGVAVQGVEVGSSGWQCQHDTRSFVCDTANAEDGEQPLTLHVTAPAAMGTHTLQLTVATTTDGSQQSREHSRTLAFGQASDALQQQLELAEESGATSFILPEGIFVGSLYNRPAYPLTLIGSAQNELWLQGDTTAGPLLSADSLEQVRLHAAGAVTVSGAIRHSELHLLQGVAALSVPVVTASKLYLEGTGFAALAGDSDLRLENNLLVAEAAAAQLSAPAALFTATTGHKPYRQLLGNTLVNITALTEDASQASWQVANNLLLSEVARDSFTLLGGDLQEVSFSHNLLPTACQWLEGENIYSDTPGVEAATGYTPTSDSPVLDAGDAGMTGELSDLYGNSRLVGAGVDIGAVERQ